MSFLRGRAPEFDLAEALVSYAYRTPQTPSMDDMDEERKRGTTEVLRVVDDREQGEQHRSCAVQPGRDLRRDENWRACVRDV